MRVHRMSARATDMCVSGAGLVQVRGEELKHTSTWRGGLRDRSKSLGRHHGRSGIGKEGRGEAG